jgi:hypothetical protein
MFSQTHRIPFVLLVILVATVLLLLPMQTANSSSAMPGDMCDSPHHSQPESGIVAPLQTYPFEVYNDPNWSGTWCLATEPKSANIHSSCNDQTSSVYLRTGWSVRLYRDQNQGGPSICFNRSDENLNNNTFQDNSPMDNAISSFTLYDQPWCAAPPSPAYPLEVYNDANYGGHWCYSTEAKSANIHSSCHDQISSILLRSGWSIRVYRDQNQSGPSRCLNSSDSDMSNNTFEDGSPMNDAISSFILYGQANCGGTPELTRSRLYVDGRNYLVLEFCGRNIHQDVYVGSKRAGRDFGVHAKHVDFGSSEQCAIDDNLADGSVLPSTTYYSGVALNAQDVHIVCSSSRGLCDSIKTSPAEPVDPPTPPPGGSCPVPHYWQGDPQWASNHFGTCSCTIGGCGCALTSLTMAFKYYGVNHNPGSLAQCLGNSACPLVWSTACSGGKVNFNGWHTFSWSELESELQQGRPVILQLNRSRGMHFVVAVSGSGSSAQGYLVNDPALKQGARVKLSAVLARRSYWPNSMRLFSGTPDCQMAVAEEKAQPLTVPELALTGVPLEPEQVSGATGSPSTQPITGSVILYRNTETTMTLELAAHSSAGNVTEMLIWTDSITNTTWQPFTYYVALPLSEQFFVQFRDDADNISALVSNTSDPDSPLQVGFVFLPLILGMCQ